MKKKVLLVADDEPMNRMIIRKFLKDSYEVIEAVDGRAAVETLDTRHVDALLLDIIMPEMDGLEVLAHMKQDPRYAQIGVLVATSTKEKTERTALELGADDIVSKPYDPVVIRKRIENILAMKEIHQQRESLKNHDTERYVQDSIQELQKKVEPALNRISKYAGIISANKSNLKLVGEITTEIQTEVTAVKAVFETEGQEHLYE